MREDWDHYYYYSRNSGSSVHLANLTAWLETGKATNQLERLQRKSNGTDQGS